MNKISISLISCAMIALVPSAYAVEEANPPVETTETAPASSGSSFNFSIPGETATPSSGFNFSDATEVKEGETALGKVDLPVDHSVKVESFDTELKLPTAETKPAE